MTVKSLVFKITLALVLLLCLLGIYTAFTWIMGDLYGYKVRYAVEQWQEQDGLPKVADINQVIEDVDSAIGWEVDNPQYHELKARALYYKALALGVDDEGLIYIELAKKSHILAISLRPKWPYSWANLVLMKSYLKEWDDEYSAALDNAVRFGPWEQSVHLTLAHAGALSWAHLSIEQKKAIAENVERGIVRNMQGIAFNLDAYKKRSLVCAYMQRDERQKKFCSKR